MNSKYKFENVYADNSYILEDENENGRQIFCGWQNFYDSESHICSFYLSVFEEQKNGSYTRADEEQFERCYELDEVKMLLDKCGFELLGAFADVDFSQIADDSERFYFVARAKK